MSEIIEVMARAFCFVGDHCKKHCPDRDHRPCPDASSQWGDQAREALAALEAAGYVVAPVEPSLAMLEAGCLRSFYRTAPKSTWAAMLKASKQEGGCDGKA